MEEIKEIFKLLGERGEIIVIMRISYQKDSGEIKFILPFKGIVISQRELEEAFKKGDISVRSLSCSFS